MAWCATHFCSNGRLAASLIGWAMWLSYIGNPPTEAAAVVQYASDWWHGPSWWQNVFAGGSLTAFGTAVAVALMAVFVVVNCFGVKVFAKSNNVVTMIKVFIPVLTINLIVSALSSSSSSESS